MKLSYNVIDALSAVTRSTGTLNIGPGVPAAPRHRNPVINFRCPLMGCPHQPPQRFTPADLASPLIAVKQLEPIYRLIGDGKVSRPLAMVLATLASPTSTTRRAVDPALVSIFWFKNRSTDLASACGAVAVASVLVVPPGIPSSVLSAASK
jgi:hypothetical protein